MVKAAKINAMIDRLEDGIAVIFLGDDEDVMLELPTCYLPDDIEEGDILTFKVSVNSRKTKRAKNKVAGMLKKLIK
jgi:hypothetical protein